MFAESGEPNCTIPDLPLGEPSTHFTLKNSFPAQIDVPFIELVVCCQFIHLTQFVGRLDQTMSVMNKNTLVVCGGYYTEDTCISWSKDSPDNAWEFFSLLRSLFQLHLMLLFHFLHVAHQGNFACSPSRLKGVSYSTEDKILIMGGDDEDARQTGVVLSAAGHLLI